MDGLLALYIYLLTGLAKFSHPLSVIGFGEYREWHPGEKLKILLVGYNGARNADRWKEKHPEVELILKIGIVTAEKSRRAWTSLYSIL